MGYKAALRRPVLWAILVAGETLTTPWCNGDHVWWLVLRASFRFSTCASEMFAKKGLARRTECGGPVWRFYADSIILLPPSGRRLTGSRFGFMDPRVTSCKTGAWLRGSGWSTTTYGRWCRCHGSHYRGFVFFIPPSSCLVVFGSAMADSSCGRSSKATAALRGLVALEGGRVET